MKRSLKIVIIGAGIGGLTAALALRHYGFDVRVFEQSPDFVDVGAGLQLAPNPVKVLRALGLAKELRRVAAEPTNMVSLDWHGKVEASEPMRGAAMQQFGAEYFTVHRADLRRLLTEAVPASCLHLGIRCVGVSSTDRGGVACFADGSEVEADVIIGSDGIHSVVRKTLRAADRPRFTRQICWRGIVPTERLLELGRTAGWPFQPTDYVNWLGPTGRVLGYPIRRGEMFNIFAGHVSDAWADESWSLPSGLDEIQLAYRGWSEPMLAIFQEVESWFKWGVFDRDPLTNWTQESVTLLGDAAHPMMPTLAQGAAQAIEDGYVLARCLARHIETPRRGLETYEAARRPRTTRLQLAAREQFELNLQVPPKPRPSRDWIFAYDATAELDGFA